MIEFCGKAYREGGQWKMIITLPEWVISDIVRDSEHLERTVIMLEDMIVQNYPGDTSYYRQSGKEKLPKVIAAVVFEEQNVGD